MTGRSGLLRAVGLVGALASAAARADDAACLAVGEVAAHTQVVWISPVRDRVRARAWMEVVELSDLEAWAKANDKQPARILQAVGLVGKKAHRATSVLWKATIFDVERASLCRPIAGSVPGAESTGVAACATDEQHAAHGARPGFTGCGYTLDTGAGTRGVDVLRVRWEDAASQGFCVMPLQRFLEGL